jgi:serine/threonine-protein kinase
MKENPPRWNNLQMPEFEFLGPYRIGKPLGRGGMGTVYAAVHEKTGEQVAVKLIAAHVADEPRFRRRFDDEVKTLQQLRHKNIVRLIGFGEEQGQLFYSMELVTGETLQARIRREKKIGWSPALEIAIEVCAALKHAHDFGIIHRDLKPANLLLSATGGVKLVDFGIAKIFGDGELTLAGSVLGTADFMAPEQATGSGVSVRTDLYALGSVMYAMLAGRPPFRGKSVTEVIASLKRDRPVPLDLIDPNLPEAIVDVVHQLLEKDPARRPPTALAVMNRLKAMRAGLQKQETVMAQAVGTRIDRGRGDGSDEPLAASGPATDSRTAVTDRATAELLSAASAPQAEESLVSPVAAGPQSLPEVTSEQVKPEPRTHFQTVSEAARRTGFFTTEPDETPPTWWRWLSILAMIIALLIVALIVVKTIRPPSADQLYAEAMEAADTAAMNAFLQRHPHDPRHREVEQRYLEESLAGQLKRIEAQRKIGVTPLHPYEESFAAAMQLRHERSDEAIERLKQWLILYDTPENSSNSNLSRLIELARYQQQRLESHRSPPPIDPRAETMIQEIRQLAAETDSATARQKLHAIVESFQSIQWAAPAVDEARRQVATLDEFSQ